MCVDSNLCGGAHASPLCFFSHMPGGMDGERCTALVDGVLRTVLYDADVFVVHVAFCPPSLIIRMGMHTQSVAGQQCCVYLFCFPTFQAFV